MKSILGIGNALVDILINIDQDKFLNNFKLGKGGMWLVENQLINEILKTQNKNPKKSVGGSVANTIHSLGLLGNQSSFIGKVGRDELGELFESDLKEQGVKTHISRGILPTGKALVLISPDLERTFATYLGSSVELNADDLRGEFFLSPDLLYLEGYLVLNQELLKKAVKFAKKNELKIAMDLSSYNVVLDNLDFLKSFVKNYVDILFTNEEETKAFLGYFDPRKNLKEFADYCKITVLKVGREGAFILANNKEYKIDPQKTHCVDTTGAGDLFAAGFLHGWGKGYDIQKCGEIGSILASNVIQVIGAKMDDQKWSHIKKRISLYKTSQI